MNETTGRKATERSALAKMREPFAPNLISQLPKPTCSWDEYKKLPKAKCNICGGHHATSKTIHLSYVGHAALTDRLLDVDPLWSWEPVAFGEDGLPAFDNTGGLWIRLTVCGVTRLGYGNAKLNSYADIGAREKEVIGDALRNAAMRFGAALELWHKGDLHTETQKTSADFEALVDKAKTADEVDKICNDNIADINKMSEQEKEKLRGYCRDIKKVLNKQ